MWKTLAYSLRRSLLDVAVATVFLACAKEGTGPTSPVLGRAVELGSCTNLQAPAGSKLAYHTYAKGVQIYWWDGASWTLVAPWAQLYADSQLFGLVGAHYAGPTWESASGSKVVGTVLDRCQVPNAIPWLSLKGEPTDAPGVFQRVTFIQRVNTVGGVAPSVPGSVVGEETSVPYSAEYYFYRP
jgi:hypothetical protein